MNGESHFFWPRIRELLGHDEVRIRSVLYTDSSCYDWWSYMFHSYEDQVELVLFLQGSGVLYHNLNPNRFETGDVLLKLPGDTFSEYPTEGTHVKRLSILLESNRDHRVFDAFHHSRYLPVYRKGDYQGLLKEIFSELYHLQKKKKGLHKLLQNQLLSSVFTMLELSEKRMETEFTGVDDRVKMVASYIDGHYRENISLQEVSEVFDLSPAYLAKIFKAETGYTINQYIVHCRIGNAEKILMYEKENNMRELALACGFSTVQYFYSTFHRHTLCTPVEYRSRYR